MRRRDVLLAALMAPSAFALSRGFAFAATAPATKPLDDTPPDEAAFDAFTVRNLARQRAQAAFKAPSTKLPDQLAHLTYDQYRTIRFNPQRAIWGGGNSPFTMEFFHRGFLYQNKVEIYEVADGKARPFRYDPSLFTFGQVQPPPAGEDTGYAGFRLHATLNRPDYFDEVCAFLGASYFRAVAKGQGYGLSARGLAIKTADPGGEEFPIFTDFWVERPHPGIGSIVVSALLDSPSATAAYRFTIRPGEETIFDVEATIFPRADITQVGVAPMTSMFFFDANDRSRVDDYRPAVHDSNGLLMLTGRGEQIWRPLDNPEDLQASAFSDVNPRGFGLMQRRRDFAAFDDLEAHYEKRPSLWVEPIGDWGEGAVDLIEIPTDGEIHDNIVAFWRPKQPLRAKGEYGFTYRLHWCADVPLPSRLGRVLDTRAGADKTNRLFVIDFAGEDLKGLKEDPPPPLEVTTTAGKILNPVAQPNPEIGGWRVSFELDPGDAKLAELRAQLKSDNGPLTEAWVYRWTTR